VPDILGSVLVDAGPLIAAAVKRDRYHRSAVEWFRDHPQVALITTLPALTEACHALIPVAQSKLLRTIHAGTLRLCPIDEADAARAAELIERYRELPMDFADASIIIASEKLGIVDVLSVDHDDFDVYRSTKGRPFHNWFPRLS
jgi:predicted nucleic acid-binding protein